MEPVPTICNVISKIAMKFEMYLQANEAHQRNKFNFDIKPLTFYNHRSIRTDSSNMLCNFRANKTYWQNKITLNIKTSHFAKKNITTKHYHFKNLNLVSAKNIFAKQSQS